MALCPYGLDLVAIWEDTAGSGFGLGQVAFVRFCHLLSI